MNYDNIACSITADLGNTQITHDNSHQSWKDLWRNCVEDDHDCKSLAVVMTCCCAMILSVTFRYISSH